MSTLIQKATNYITEYVREHYRPTPEDKELYNDKWIDNFSYYTKHDFPIVTSNELMEAINYCNKYSELHDFNQDFTTVEDIASHFLATHLVELNILK
jgi:hypothetical protein